jgi:predicted membrane chloride channel (bestrophin family)
MLETTLNAIVMDWQKCDSTYHIFGEDLKLTETAIRSTPIPTGYIIHQKQVLALYLMILPFSVVDIMGWSGVPVMALTAFTLYGIEGIGRQLEDPL